MKNLYLILAVVGGVVPTAFYVQHVISAGPNPGTFLSALAVNPVVSGLTADLVLASLAFWVGMIHEWRSGSGPSPLWFVVLNLGVGLSCAVPAYLYARERHAALEHNAG
jgi:hypothetical protein